MRQSNRATEQQSNRATERQSNIATRLCLARICNSNSPRAWLDSGTHASVRGAAAALQLDADARANRVRWTSKQGRGARKHGHDDPGARACTRAQGASCGISCSASRSFPTAKSFTTLRAGRASLSQVLAPCLASPWRLLPLYSCLFTAPSERSELRVRATHVRTPMYTCAHTICQRAGFPGAGAACSAWACRRRGACRAYLSGWRKRLRAASGDSGTVEAR